MQHPTTIALGQVVTTVAGRDQGHMYVVVGFEKSGRLLLADGRARLFHNPKKKNSRHVVVHKKIDCSVAEKLNRKETVTGELLRQAIRLAAMTENFERMD